VIMRARISLLGGQLMTAVELQMLADSTGGH